MRCKAPPLSALVCTLIGVGILLSLGVWQIQRLYQKQILLDQIARAYADPTPPAFNAKQLAAADPFTRGTLDGVISPTPVFTVGYGPQAQQFGLFILMPPKGAARAVMVNWGEGGIPKERGSQKITGFLKPYPAESLFSLKNNPALNIWLSPRLADFQSAVPHVHVYPVIFYPDSVHGRPEPANNHLSYAMFWFAMAGVMLAMAVLRFCIQKG